MPINILHVTTTFFPDISGISTRIHVTTQKVLSVQNHSVAVFDRIDERQLESDTFEGLRVRRFDRFSTHACHPLLDPGPKVQQSIEKALDFIRQIAPTCIVLYHSRYPRTFMHAIAGEFPIVYIPIVEPTDSCSLLLDSPQVKIALYGEACVDDYLQIGFDSRQILVLDGPIDTDVFRPLDVPRDPFRLLYVGRLDPNKCIPEFIEINAQLFRDHPRLHLHIVGDMKPSALTDAVENEVRRIRETADHVGLSDRIVFRGRCSEDELLQEYSEASIHVLPSRIEAMSTVTQEAITMGLQCVNLGKRRCDWPEFTPDGKRLVHYVERFQD
ncbi:MAG: glycosyltransferase family 4 protein, partial [bacterium]